MYSTWLYQYRWNCDLLNPTPSITCICQSSSKNTTIQLHDRHVGDLNFNATLKIQWYN